MQVTIIDISFKQVSECLNNPTCVYDYFYSMCDDNMDIITVLKDITNNDVEDVTNDICVN